MINILRRYKVIISIFLVMAVVVTLIVSSYALFSSTVEKNERILITATTLPLQITTADLNEDFEVTVPTGYQKVLTVKVENKNAIDVQLHFSYQVLSGASNDLYVGYSDNSINIPPQNMIVFATDRIDSYTIVIDNRNSSVDATIKFNFITGLVGGGALSGGANSSFIEQRIVPYGTTLAIYTPTGGEQVFKAPKAGYYTFDLYGHNGARTVGTIYLNLNETLYIHVGDLKSYNATYPFSANRGGVGGGATDVRLVSSGSAWYQTNSLLSRIMVAAGSAGMDADTISPAGYAGGLVAPDTYSINQGDRYARREGVYKGANQRSGGTSTISGAVAGSFGKGGYDLTSADAGGGGGGGYFGGVGTSSLGTGTGGSSFISGYAGVNAVGNGTALALTNNTNHYSNKYFIRTKMESGISDKLGKATVYFYGDEKPNRDSVYSSVRYIKDSIGGNTVNAGNHWIELQAIKDGVNIAKGKVLNTDSAIKDGLTYAVDGIVDDHTRYANLGVGTNGQVFVQLDLGGYYDLDEIAVWHFYEDDRSYYKGATTINKGATWATLNPINTTSNIETDLGIRYSPYEEPTDFLPSTSLSETLKRTKNATLDTTTEKGITMIKGTNPNNYVYFSGFLYRAIYYNDDTVRLVMDELATVIGFGNPETKKNYKISNVQQWLNQYFYSKISSRYRFFLEKNKNCYDVYSSLTAASTMACNTPVVEDIGLLSLGEYNSFGGNNSYLNNGYNFWLGGFLSNTDNPVVVKDGVVTTTTAAEGVGVRPVITIRSNYSITKGDGSKSNPYYYEELQYPEPLRYATSGSYAKYNNKLFRIQEALASDKYETGIKMIYAGPAATFPESAFDTNINNNIMTSDSSTNIASKLNSLGISQTGLINSNWVVGYQDFDSCTFNLKCAFGRNGNLKDTSIYSSTIPGYIDQAYIYTGKIALPSYGDILVAPSDTYGKQDFWTMTKRTGNKKIWAISGNGIGSSSSGISISSLYYIRPVVMLPYTTSATSGTGTYNDPYIIAG